MNLRLLSGRRNELVARRTQIVCRIHRDLQNLLRGGPCQRMIAKRDKVVPARIRPRDEITKRRRSLVAEQVRELAAADARMAAAPRDIKQSWPTRRPD